MLNIGRGCPREHPPTSRGSPIGDDVTSGYCGIYGWACAHTRELLSGDLW